MSGVPLIWSTGDRCYVPRRGTGLVSKVTEAGVSVMFDTGRVAIVPYKSVRLRVEAPDEPESSVLKKVMLAVATAGGVHVMRNNVGAIKKGQRFIRYGLGVGSADVVAIVAPYGRWLCIETKRPKNAEASTEQERWLALMRRYGAVAGVCRTPEEALRLVDEARRAVA